MEPTPDPLESSRHFGDLAMIHEPMITATPEDP